MNKPRKKTRNMTPDEIELFKQEIDTIFAKYKAMNVRMYLLTGILNISSGEGNAELGNCISQMDKEDLACLLQKQVTSIFIQ